MMLFDTHSHLFWDSYKEDFDQVLNRAEENGVTTILNVGVDLESSKKCANLLSSNQKITFYSSIAIHPEEAIKYFNNEDQLEKDIAQLELIYLQHPNKVIAVGECGLDFAYASWEGYLNKEITPEEMKKLQRKLFIAHIDLAKKLNLPLLLHIRDDRTQNTQNSECWDEAIEKTKDHFGIYHCYSGLLQTTKKLSPNFMVSFAGNCTYKKNDYLKEAIQFLPLEQIVLETDCPFLPPQSKRGKRNEPANIKEIAEFIANLKAQSLESVSNQTTKNAQKILRINAK